MGVIVAITFSNKGSWDKTNRFLKTVTDKQIFASLEAGARAGVAALENATPAETGLTASSWTYEVRKNGGGYGVEFFNHHTVDGTPVAVLIQYGHGTGTGGYVQGRDFINPALRPIFDKIADQVWKAVTSA